MLYYFKIIIGNSKIYKLTTTRVTVHKNPPYDVILNLCIYHRLLLI